MVVASVCLVELAGRILPAAKNADIATVEKADVPEDKPADMQPDVVPEIVPRKPRTPHKRDTGQAVAKLRARNPDLPAQEIARRLGVTDRTVRRHLSAAA